MITRVALIGAGRMGRRHAQKWARLPEVEVVGVLDPRTEAAAALGPAFSEWQTLLAQAKPDVVDICTPTGEHRDGVLRAVAAGKAVFVEKPLARTLEDCDAIVEAVERAGTPFMAGHVVRFFPPYAAAKRIVDNGGVGTPAAIRTARLSGFPGAGDSENWYADSAQSGGVILDLLLHDFDWMRWTFGPITRVFAVGSEQYALVTLRFASGAVGHATGSWKHAGGFRTTLEVAGDAGLIEHDSVQSASLHTPSGPESPLAEADDPYYQELAAFVRALRDGEPPPISVHDAREAVRIALAARDSQQTGKMVTLS